MRTEGLNPAEIEAANADRQELSDDLRYRQGGSYNQETGQVIAGDDMVEALHEGGENDLATIAELEGKEFNVSMQLLEMAALNIKPSSLHKVDQYFENREQGIDSPRPQQELEEMIQFVNKVTEVAKHFHLRIPLMGNIRLSVQLSVKPQHWVRIIGQTRNSQLFEAKARLGKVK